jgi:hypothetical protein
MPQSNGIGTLSEKSLHASLKTHYARAGDEIEALVDGFHIDVKRGNLLIEIQTRNFSAIKKKLSKLLENYQVHLVHPIAQLKWITRVDRKGRQVARRKSPKQGKSEDIFSELIRIPHLIGSPNLSVEIALIEMEEIWIDDGLGSWRRGKWSIQDRKLVRFVSSQKLEDQTDYLDLIPSKLDRPFTVKELASAKKINQKQAQKMAYSLRKMGLINIVRKQGNANVFDIDSRFT